MTLWLLRPIEVMCGFAPWGMSDTANGFVIRAATEADARGLADGQQGDEGGLGKEKTHPWLDCARTTCAPLMADGAEEIIMVDFVHG